MIGVLSDPVRRVFDIAGVTTLFIGRALRVMVSDRRPTDPVRTDDSLGHGDGRPRP